MIKNLQTFYESLDWVFVKVLSSGTIPVINILLPSHDDENSETVDFLEKFQETQHAEEQAMLDAYRELQTVSRLENNNNSINSTLQSSINQTCDTVNTTFENLTMLTNHSQINGHAQSPKKTNTTLSEWDVISSENSPCKSTSEEIEARKVNKPSSSKTDIQLDEKEQSKQASLDTSERRTDSPVSSFSALWGIPEIQINQPQMEGIIQDTTDPYKFSVSSCVFVIHF